MTSRRLRKIRAANSAAGILRRIREDDWMTGPDAASWPPPRQRVSFTCPDCKRRSFHPEDVKNAYCHNCEQWMTPRCMDPDCPDFGDYDFGEGTCPAEHVEPPAWRTPAC